MASTPPETVLGTVEHTGMPGILTVEHAPHPADVLDTDLPHRRHIVAVTEEHGLQVKEISDPDLRFNPNRAEGARTVTDVTSFLAELHRRPLTAETGTLWGNAARGEVIAIYNDHEGGDNTDSLGKDDRAPGWRDDRLILKLPAHPDWVQWHTISGQYFPQGKFGDIIEELRHTITEPDQADLLEIIDSVRASIKGEFNSTIDRGKGGLKVAYKKEVSAQAGAVGRELKVPEHIKLSITPWDGHDKLYEVPAYFRLDITEGKLHLAVKLFPTRELVRTAWADLTKVIVDTVGKPVYAQP